MKQSPLLNVVLNIALPVWILNASAKSSHPWAAEIGVGLATLLPLGHALYDWVKFRKRNLVAALGLVNVLLTGGFALLSLPPYWFVFKEAAFPFLLGVAVLASQWIGEKSFFQAMIADAGTVDFAKVEQRAKEHLRAGELVSLLERCNVLFSTSFFISAILNFALAHRIFKSFAADLPELERKARLNQQIAEMNWQGWIVIALPLTVLTMIIFWFFFSRVQKITGLTFEEMTDQA
jgi:alkanesulfonate monooxygenase SsuD/methylene tetrahydromethanopterin reductase-like flavin-dependent oxidoreductase (luciferase family)